MASLQARRVRGHTYWHIVESRRVNGKPRPVPVAYLGKADDLLARIRETESLRLRSHSHGAVAALWALAQKLDLARIIDDQLATDGRRPHGGAVRTSHPRQGPVKNDGLTVGQSLVLASIGRAAHPTSKRGFAPWALTTTLGELAAVDVERLTSQHFWDQMDQVPIPSIEAIERQVVARVLDELDLPLDTLLFDATNFFTFIASANARPKLPARGHNKQKRNDLRQVGVALLCSRHGGIPLWHQTYGGSVSDATCFADVFPAIQQRLIELRRDIASMTIVFDKGNVSRRNQRLVDESRLHYVTGLTTASQHRLVEFANSRLEPVELQDGQVVMAYRDCRVIWEDKRTAIVVLSERLRQGQMRGILQHVSSAQRWLSALADTLRRGKQKRDRSRIQRDIEKRLHGRQHLGEVLRFTLTGDDPRLSLSHEFDQDAFDRLARDKLGRVVLITDRHDWSTAEIIDAYHGQAGIEAVFAHLKDPTHLALRPQFHWTDQKLQVHVLTCILGYLLATTLFHTAKGAGAPHASQESLLDALSTIRQVTVVRPAAKGKGRLRLSKQLEDVDPPLLDLLARLGIGGQLLYTPGV